MTNSLHYAFATFDLIDDATSSEPAAHLQPVLELTEEEYEECARACLELDNYRNDVHLFQLVVWNYEEYNALFDDTLAAYISKKFYSFSRRRPDLNLNRCVMNLLSSIRSYLDYTELNIKRRHGEASLNWANFKQYTSEAYDGSFSYRFLYKFRNFAQHCGLPLTRVHFNASENDGYSLDVGINRDELLSKDFKWGPIAPDIAMQPEEMSINNHVDEMVKVLSEIHSKCMTDEMSNVRESATLLRKYISRLQKPVGELHLIRFPSLSPNLLPGGRIQFRLQVVPVGCD